MSSSISQLNCLSPQRASNSIHTLIAGTANNYALNTNNNSTSAISLLSFDDLLSVSTTHNTPTDQGKNFERNNASDSSDSCEEDYDDDGENYVDNDSATNNTTTTTNNKTPNNINNNTTINNRKQRKQSKESSEACCARCGTMPFCCSAFEKRVLNWVEQNVPRMANPESKKEAFFTSKKSTLLQRSSSIRLTVSDLEESENNSEASITTPWSEVLSATSPKLSQLAVMSMSIMHSVSAPSSQSQYHHSLSTQQTKCVNINASSPFPSSLEESQSNSQTDMPINMTQSMSLIESLDKMGSTNSSLLMRRRQSQINAKAPISKFLSGNVNSARHRLSILTTMQSSQQENVINEENN